MKQTNDQLQNYWADIPVGIENAIDYPTLMAKWHKDRRNTRAILHDLSLYDNGDNYVLIRSSKSKGFYKTDDPQTLAEFRVECLNKGKSTFAPVRKINRVLRTFGNFNMSVMNNMRVMREANGMTQDEVCDKLNEIGVGVYFDKSLLSKMENGYCLPNVIQANEFAKIYKCEVVDIINYEILTRQ